MTANFNYSFCLIGNYIFGSFKIIDEDIDISKVTSGDIAENDEDPTIAEIIDERPDSVKNMEAYAVNPKWKKIVGK